ncbi:MAG: ABC-2 family transporter protein [Dehalococcoidia bacterium]
MGNELRLFPRLAWSRVRGQLEYRLSFALMLIGYFIMTLTDFLAIWVIFQHLPLLAGWSLGEVAFLYGTSYVSFKIADMIVGHLDMLPTLVRTGGLDTVLTRPLGSLYQVVTIDFGLRHVGAIAQGSVILVIACATAGIPWDAGRALMLVVTIACGTAIFIAIWITGATTVFWTLGSGLEVLNAFTYGGNQMANYPINIYAGWLRRIIAFFVPLAFVTYFPSLYILAREDPLHAPEMLRFASPLVAIAALLVARAVWGQGIRHYQSTGS